jgi:hypothetical protein
MQLQHIFLRLLPIIPLCLQRSIGHIGIHSFFSKRYQVLDSPMPNLHHIPRTLVGLLGLLGRTNEILKMIADYLDRSSIAAMTLVCRRSRQLFRHRLFEKLKFTGNLWDLSYRLHLFNLRVRVPNSCIALFRHNTR